MYQKIILAYDGSHESQQALLNCKDLSQWEQAKVHLLSVVPYESNISMGHETSYYSEPENRLAEEKQLIILNDGVAQLSAARIEAAAKLMRGDAVDQIVKYAKTISADLIMLGHQHWRNWLKRWWTGSIPKALVEHAPCSVLVFIIRYEAV